MRAARWVLLLLLALAIGLLVYPAINREGERTPRGQTVYFEPAPKEAGFRRVLGPRELHFPEDHGPHPDYQTEWWYYTGNLEGEGGERFGYQLTFFRRALRPASESQTRASNWAASQVYMAHFAVTDVGNNELVTHERFARGALGLAGATASPYHVWTGSWGANGQGPGAHRLQADHGDIQIDLVLQATVPPIPHGDRGYSPKGPKPGQASHYYSYTRMRTQGMLRIGEAAYAVSGQSWMDHEWSTSALGEDQVGWDWFSIQLADGSDLMLFQLRDDQGGIDPFSSGTHIGPSGEMVPLAADDFDVQVLELWRSPGSGATYPARWRVRIPSLGIRLIVEPLVKDQELELSYIYWEGAVSVHEDRPGTPAVGYGYVEVTGYARSIQGQF